MADEHGDMCESRSPQPPRSRQQAHMHQPVLLEYFRSGLTGVRSEVQKKLAEEVSEKTGLTYQQIKDWVGNHKKGIAAAVGIPAKKSIPMRAKSGRDLFVSQVMSELKDVPSAQRLAVATARWQQLSHSEAAAYHSQAVTFNASHTPADTASANTAAYTHKLLLQMSNLVRKLSEVGAEVLVITVDSKTGHSRKLGTDRALDFLNKRTDILSQMATFLSDNGTPCTQTRVLQDRVKKLFNDKYCAATGMAACSYAAVQRGDVSIQGLPDGIQFKTPGSYGIKSCIAILDCVQEIKFVKHTAESILLRPTSQSTPTALTETTALIEAPTALRHRLLPALYICYRSSLHIAFDSRATNSL